MKKLLALMLALTLTGCAAQSAPEQEQEPIPAPPTAMTESEEPDPWGITLTAKNVTPTGLIIVCTQLGGEFTGELSTGSPYWLEVDEDGVWLPYPTKQTDFAWTAEGWMIPLEGSVEWETDWNWLYGELPKGHYRIGKSIMDWRAPGEYDERPCYAEFTIG